MKKGLFRKGLVLGIIIIFIGASVIPSIGGKNVVRKVIPEKKNFNNNFNHRGNILYVGGSGEGNYTSIQEAIDDANDSDTIFVYDDSSPYFEDIYIYKTIDLVGENKLTTEIKGYYSWIESYFVNISGFTISFDYIEIYGSQTTIKENIITNINYGIWIYDSINCVFSENIIKENLREILFYNCYNCIISDNIISNNSNCFSFQYCTDCIISGNTFFNNTGGIKLYYSEYNNITNNNFSNCENSINLEYNSNYNNILNNSIINDGLTIKDSYKNTISSNLVNNKPILYLEDESDRIIDYVITAGQVILIGCDNISVNNLEISNTSIGITVLNTNNSKFNNNIICSNNKYGIFLTPGRNGYSNNNLIFGNTLKNNIECGIYLDSSRGYSKNNIIKNNNIISNGNGICTYDSYDNQNSFTIVDNIISSNFENGLNIHESYNNKITGNILSDNNNGLLLTNSYNNIFKNNSFQNNSNSLCVEGDDIIYYYQDIDTTNTIDGEKIYYLLEQSDLVIDETYNVGYICLISCHNITLQNLIITNEINGLLIVNTTYSNFENLKIFNNSQSGILLKCSHNNSINECNIYENVDNKGINLYLSTNNSITYCHIYDNDNGIYISSSAYNNITGNNITKNNNGIILFSGYYYYYHGDNNKISDNKIINNYIGINLGTSIGNIISRNSIINNFYGVNSFGGWNFKNIINSNNISSNEYGIFFQYYTEDCIIYNNTCNSNNVSGIYLDSCYNVLISQNNCSLNSGHGITLKYSDDCVIDGNILNDNKAVFKPNTTGLIGYWKLDEEYWNGTVGEVVDSSGYGNNGTARNGANTTEEGVFGRCGDFDGQNDYVEVPNIIDGLNAVTIEAWFNFVDSDTWRWVYGGGPDWNNNPGMSVHPGVNVMRYHWRTTLDSFYNQDGSIEIIPNTWNHIAYIFDGSTIKSYVNGELDFVRDSRGTIVAPLTQAIGAGFWQAHELFYGYIDEVKIYNRALSHNEIIQLINANGIQLYQSDNNIISNNSCRKNRYGINLESHSSNNILKNNTCINNQCGINLNSSSSYCRITENKCSYNKLYGIHIGQSSTSTVIDNNLISNNSNGINIYQSRRNEIDQNTILSNYRDGLYLQYSNSNTITGNNISSNNGKGLILKWSSNNEISRNSILHNYIGIETTDSFINTIEKNNIDMNFNYGIYLFESIGYDINNNNFSNNYCSIFLEKCENIMVSDNTMTMNEVSLNLLDTKDIYILNNTLKYSFDAGINGRNCENCYFSNNYLDETGYDGLNLLDSINCYISENTISEFGTGINIRGSVNISISGCEISDNGYGILFGYSNYNTASDNNVTNNYYGIKIDYRSENNTIYHNNFINNEKNSSYDEGINIWDDGEYGNYWDDYKGKHPNAKKLRLKGIWDTPYNIEGGDNKDYYPLLKQWPKPSSTPTPKIHMKDSSLFLRILNYFPLFNLLLERFPIFERLLSQLL
jgi:parallel beta-helix repeat protein